MRNVALPTRDQTARQAQGLASTDPLGVGAVCMEAGARSVPEKKTWPCRLAVGAACPDLTEQHGLSA